MIPQTVAIDVHVLVLVFLKNKSVLEMFWEG